MVLKITFKYLDNTQLEEMSNAWHILLHFT